MLKQLVAYVGRDSFFAGIHGYLAEHGWANATLADLLRAITASSGKDLAGWSAAWLETAGPNTLRSQFEVAADGAFTSFAVLQEAPAAHPTLRPHHIAIGLYHRANGALARTRRVEVDVTGPRTAVPELVGDRQPDLILLNDDDLGYALVRFDPRSLATLTESIGDFTDSLARAVCWSAAIDMVQEAELSLPAFVRLLANGMGKEPSVSVLQTLHLLTARLLAFMADPASVRNSKEDLATAAMRLLRSAEPGSDHQLAWAQLLGWTAVTPDQLDLLAGLLDGSAAIPGLAIDTDLRWTLLARLAATGRAGDAEIDAELARDETDAGQRHAAACRAAIPDAEHKAAAWVLLAESEDLGVEGVRASRRRSRSPSTRRCSLRTWSGTSRSCPRSGLRAASTSGCCWARCCSRTRRPRRSWSAGSARSWTPRSATRAWRGWSSNAATSSSGRCARGPCPPDGQAAVVSRERRIRSRRSARVRQRGRTPITTVGGTSGARASRSSSGVTS